jgi:hypothetical protein
MDNDGRGHTDGYGLMGGPIPYVPPFFPLIRIGTIWNRDGIGMYKDGT